MTSQADIATSLELAGATRADGSFERPVPDIEWQVPAHVWLDGEVVRWRAEPEDLGSEERSNPWVSSGPSLLQDFLRLGSADGSRIALFAKRWGVLRLCPHGLPATHPPHLDASALVGRAFRSPRGEFYLDPVDSCVSFIGPAGSESLEAWWTFSTYVAAILRVAGALHTESDGDAPDWVRLLGSDWPITEQVPPHLVRHVLGSIVDQLLRVADVRVQFGWLQGPPEIAFTTHSLVGALATQVALATARSDGMAICTACGHMYLPERRPALGRRNYCQTCRATGAPERDAQRARRARNRRLTLEPRANQD